MKGCQCQGRLGLKEKRVIGCLGLKGFRVKGCLG